MKRTALLLAGLLAAGPALAKGPPWISVELPPNRLDPDTRGAFATIRTYHHQTPAQLIMRGTAEGLVNGRRVSVPLSYRHTRQTGVFALDRTWDSTGVWVLDVRAFDGHFEMSAVVGIGTTGEATFVRVPLSRSGAPRTVSQGEVSGMLTSLLNGQAPAPLRVAGYGPETLKVYAFGAAILLMLSYLAHLAIRGVRRLAALV